MGNKLKKPSEVIQCNYGQFSSNGRLPMFDKRRGGYKGPPIVEAIEAEDVDELRRLIRKGHDVNKSDTNGLSPLHVACINGNLACVRVLLEAGSRIRSCRLFLSPIHYAAQSGNIEVIQLLLAYGDGINANDSLGNSPLSLAIEFDHNLVVNLLLARGASLQGKDLLLALENGSLSVAKSLVLFSPNVISSLSLAKYRFTSRSWPVLVLLHFVGFRLEFEKFKEKNRPLDLYDFILGDELIHPPPHYNRNKDLKAFDEFSVWFQSNHSSPMSLKESARIAFYKYCDSKSVETILSGYKYIPKPIGSYLLLKDISENSFECL